MHIKSTNKGKLRKKKVLYVKFKTIKTDIYKNVKGEKILE